MIDAIQIYREFLKFPADHPLRKVVERVFDADMDFKKEGFAENAPFINSLNAIALPLQVINGYNHGAFKSLIKDKLPAKDKNTINWHNLLSALCETALMFSAIYTSDFPDTFEYEKKLRTDNKKDVDFSIKAGEFQYNVEIKSGNMLKQQIEEAVANENHQVVIADQRVMDLQTLKNVHGEDVELFGSLDNKTKDFLQDAIKKFNPEKKPDQRNVLVICWDENTFQPISALLSKYGGLLKDNNQDYSIIDYIIVTDLYRQMEWFLTEWPSPIPGATPFFARFSSNFIVDNGYDPGDPALNYMKNVFANLRVADDAYAATLPEMRYVL